MITKEPLGLIELCNFLVIKKKRKRRKSPLLAQKTGNAKLAQGHPKVIISFCLNPNRKQGTLFKK